MKITLIYITNPTLKEAENISKHLLKKHLIACGNIHPTVSLYRWKGKIVREKEFILIAKTRNNYFEKVKTEVEKIHSYSIPCVLKIPAQANEKYFSWLVGETK